MQLNRLTLNQFRAFEEATFDFHPGMNLIVGINGVGKSTVLDAIRIAFSRVQYDFTVSKDSRLNISLDDIMIGQDSSSIELGFMTSGIPFECSVGRDKRGWAELKPDNPTILETLRNSNEQPLVLYFATRRSIVTAGREVNEEMAEGDQSVAFFEALKPRMLRLQDFTDWWLVQKTLADEGRFEAQTRLSALQDTVTSFLEWCTDFKSCQAFQR
jgi:energy-coupling factor transporter ATP-binding protein EcfA2